MSAALWWSLLASYVVRTPPNIIVILADDLGWNDVGWNNPDIKTPNLNAMAQKGVILNNAYVSNVCSPSRAALLTGKYPFKLGLQHGVIKKNKPHGLPLDAKLLPEKLKELGYATHMIGKWHLGFCNWNYTPTYRGFDTFYGFYSGQQDYYKHRTNSVRGYDFRYNTKVYRPKITQKYSTMDFARHAQDLILNHKRKKPLFMYLSFQAPHTPLQVPKKFEDMYSHIDNKDRRLFSGMVTAMDSAIGNINRALRKKRLNDNTIIVFLSDNGGTPFGGGNNWPLRGGKGTLWEGGTKVPAFIWGKPLKKAGYTNDELIHVTDWFPTLLSIAGGRADASIDGINQWQTLSKGKPSNRTEFVYGITSKAGKAAIRVSKYKLIEGSAGHYSDWFPPPMQKGNYNVKIHKNRNRLGERHLNYTLLFNVKEDPIESNNLAYRYPDIVATMKKKLEYYKAQEVPPFNPRKVRKANPKFWGGVWSPGWC